MGEHENRIDSRLTERDRVNALLALADASWRDFNARRSSEWKVSIGLWTAQALFASLVLRSDIRLTLSNLQVLAFLAIFAAVICVYSLWWTRGLQKHNNQNITDAHHYWNLVEKRLGIKSTRYERGGEPPRAHWKNWSHGSQIATTILLAALDMWCVFAKRVPGPPH